MTTARQRPVQTSSLRTVLVASLLVFALLPAATVGWFLYRSSLEIAQTLSEKIIEDVAQRVKTDTEAHLAQAHIMLNGLVQNQPDAAAVLRARQLIEMPALFEQTAFALTRMTPDVPRIYLGSFRGEYLGVEAFTQDAVSVVQVGERKQGDEGRQLFRAEYPGDRRQPQPSDRDRYEPRIRPWYQAAMVQKGRAFTPVALSAADRQLRIALA